MTPSSIPPDFSAVFAAMPELYLLLAPEAPAFTILDACDAFLKATMRTREQVVGLSVFDAFPDNPLDPAATGVRNLRASLETVLLSRQPHAMPAQRYDIASRSDAGGGFEERHWEALNSPVLDDGRVRYIVHRIVDVTARRGSALALPQIEWRYRALATASAAVLYQLNPDWSELQPLDGKGLVPSNDAPVRNWFEHNVASPDQAAVRERITHAITTKTSFEMEHRTNCPDGSFGWTRSRAVPVLDTTGEIVEWVGIAEDVTERRRAEERLVRSHDTFYHLIQNNPFGNYVVDADFRLREVSLGAQKAFANVPRPLLGRDFAEVMRILWPEAFAAEAIGRFRHTLDTGEPYAARRTVEARNDIPDVEAYDWRIERITLPDGRFGVVCHFYDLSERQQFEAALRDSEARRGAALAIADLGTFEWQVQTNAVTLDDRSRAIFGFSPSEGTQAEEVFGRIDLADFSRVFAAAQTSLRDLTRLDVEYQINLPDGEARTVASISDAVVGADGSVERMFGVFADVTERKRAEAERDRLLASERAARADAERVSRMKDEFLATLSHELRTPLNAILGWSQMLGIAGCDAEDVAEGMRVIERNARAQAKIIEDLLDMSRIISGKARLDVQRLDLAAVVRESVATSKPAAEAKGIRLQPVIDPNAGPVSGDPARLQQVLWNLLTNAIKFTPKGGRVQVLLERVNSHLEVSVIDTGEGISPEFIPFVFDRFRQADASTTRLHGGLGLGLSIVKQLVELHGGSIRVKSAGVGQGATFTVTLPLTVIHPGPEADEDRQHPRAATTVATGSAVGALEVRMPGVKVLVVDDEPDARAMVKRLLEDRDAEVITAASAAEALELVRTARPHVLASDIGMPGEDGYALIRQVRTLGPEAGGRVPAIALTAYARAEDRVNAIMAGFDMHVAKPVEPAELIAVVASLAARAG